MIFLKSLLLDVQVTVGIIACVEVTTTTTGTTPAISTTPTSGTTTGPTSVETTTICQKDMAQVGGVFVSSVTYSVQPVVGTTDADLTKLSGNGINFPLVPGTNSDMQTFAASTITLARRGRSAQGSMMPVYP